MEVVNGVRGIHAFSWPGHNVSCDVVRDSDGLYKGVYYPESHARSLGRYDEAAPLETLDNGYELGSGEQRARRTDGLRAE